jgi:cytoskeletal protein CcmA (bactofilin family)
MAQERPRAGKTSAFRTVQCYHCRRTFDVGARAMTITCPKCFKRVQVQDVIVNQAQGLTKLQTCGRIVIEKKGRVVADLVEAHEGIEVKGVIRAAVLSGGPVVLHPKSTWRGDCRAPALHIEPGAVIERGFFTIANEADTKRLDLEPLPGVSAEERQKAAIARTPAPEPKPTPKQGATTQARKSASSKPTTKKKITKKVTKKTPRKKPD